MWVQAFNLNLINWLKFLPRWSLTNLWNSTSFICAFLSNFTYVLFHFTYVSQELKHSVVIAQRLDKYKFVLPWQDGQQPSKPTTGASMLISWWHLAVYLALVHFMIDDYIPTLSFACYISLQVYGYMHFLHLKLWKHILLCWVSAFIWFMGMYCKY